MNGVKFVERVIVNGGHTTWYMFTVEERNQWGDIFAIIFGSLVGEPSAILVAEVILL